MGGQEGIERQPSQGKLTIRERLELLVDSGLFQQTASSERGATCDDSGNLADFKPLARSNIRARTGCSMGVLGPHS